MATELQGFVSFPKVLRRKLLETGMTQKFVAEAIGVTPTTVYYWASDRCIPTLKNLMMMEILFGCRPGELLVAAAYGDDPSVM